MSLPTNPLCLHRAGAIAMLALKAGTPALREYSHVMPAVESPAVLTWDSVGVSAFCQGASPAVQQHVIRLVLAGDKVARAIVGSAAIHMMHDGTAPQIMPERPLDDEDVLVHLAAAGARMIWQAHGNVPVRALTPAALPTGAGWASLKARMMAVDEIAWAALANAKAVDRDSRDRRDAAASAFAYAGLIHNRKIHQRSLTGQPCPGAIDVDRLVREIGAIASGETS